MQAQDETCISGPRLRPKALRRKTGDSTKPRRQKKASSVAEDGKNMMEQATFYIITGSCHTCEDLAVELEGGKQY